MSVNSCAAFISLSPSNGVPFSSSFQSHNSCHQSKSREGFDGYVNHGFTDSPTVSTSSHTHVNEPPFPLAQMAKFRFDLAAVKTELLQLQEVVSRSMHTTIKWQIGGVFNYFLILSACHKSDI